MNSILESRDFIPGPFPVSVSGLLFLPLILESTHSSYNGEISDLTFSERKGDFILTVEKGREAIAASENLRITSVSQSTPECSSLS